MAGKSLTDIKGVYANGIACGIKTSGKDLGYVYVPEAVASAGVFTQNKVPASSVTWTKKNLKKTILKAVIVNSGNANAVSGEAGIKATKTIARIAAEKLSLKDQEVAVGATGVIGKSLPMGCVKDGLDILLECPLDQNGEAFSEAILTTDLTTKNIFLEKKIGKKLIQVAGVTKGSGMIAPNMATTLTYLVTNVSISSLHLQSFFNKAIEDSFNMLSVDTDTSTSDMGLIFATGQHKFSLQNKTDSQAFQSLLTDALCDLAKQIAKDGEGAKKVIEVCVKGAVSKTEAKTIAKSVVESPLVKTAVAGADPNWGRVLMAIGKAPDTHINPRKIDLKFGSCNILEKGTPLPFSRDLAIQALNEEEVKIDINLNLAYGYATAWGCDLTEGYIKINTDYN